MEAHHRMVRPIHEGRSLSLSLNTQGKSGSGNTGSTRPSWCDQGMGSFSAQLRCRHVYWMAVVAPLLFSTAALAQWSIGKPGTREAPQGQNRYVYLVMSDPLPGREFDFNDGYQNMHMGDLVQLPGWTGAQRFRLVPVSPRTTQ